MDKAAGPTSHDVVDRARRALGLRRVGHAGTLDPFATGVLPLCLGRATRLARFLAESEKEYEATVRLGFATSTDDLTGDPLGPPKPVAVSPDRVEEAARAFLGTRPQVPPAYSAKHVGGRRAYERAREGETVAVAPREVTVFELRVLEVAGERVRLALRCSAGTYVRALGRDLGEELGTGAHLTALRRTRAGGFGLEEAVPEGDLTPSAVTRIVPLRACLPQLPAVTVTAEGRTAVGHGRGLGASLLALGLPAGVVPARVRILDLQGELLALGVPQGPGQGAPGLVHPDVVLVG